MKRAKKGADSYVFVFLDSSVGVHAIPICDCKQCWCHTKQPCVVEGAVHILSTTGEYSGSEGEVNACDERNPRGHVPETRRIGLVHPLALNRSCHSRGRPKGTDV